MLEQSDHVLGEVHTDQNFVGLNLASGEALEKVEQLSFLNALAGAGIENFNPDFYQLVRPEIVEDQEDLEAHIHHEVDPRVGVSVVEAKGEQDAIHNVVKPVLLNV